MRLIDADVAEKIIRDYADEVGCNRGEYELANGMLKAVCKLEDIPTAYDLDKVLEQLEKEVALENDWDDEMSCGARNAYSHAINIVKAGGIDVND